MGQIYLEIEDNESLIRFLKEAKRIGFLKNIPINKFEPFLSEKKFPIHIPIELDRVLALATNPVVKKIFGAKIDITIGEVLLKVIETE